MIENEYKTTSLSLAGALQTISSAKLERVDFSTSSNRAEFVFDKSKDPLLEKLVNQFWAKSLELDAFTYFEALKYVKSRLYEGRQQ